MDNYINGKSEIRMMIGGHGTTVVPLMDFYMD